jgi:hypothetical protein
MTLIFFIDDSASVASNSRHKYYSSCGQYIYHLAIIDYLQSFNFEKWSESRFKIWILRREPNLISAIEPEIYAERFIKFMSNEVLIDTNIIDLQKNKVTNINI